MSTTRDILIKARTYIEDPAHWTTKTYARDAEGNDVAALDDDAVCWCSAGAVIKAADALNASSPWSAVRMLDHVVSDLHPGWITPEFNDHKSHSDVLDLFDRTIALTHE